MGRRAVLARLAARMMSWPAVALCLAILASSQPAEAQHPGKTWRVVYLSTLKSSDKPNAKDAAFDAALKQLGYIEGRNVVIDRRRLGDRLDSVDDAIREVLRVNPDVLVTWAIQLSAAAKRVTNTVPIVFVAVRGPIERGLVPSLARPGGNITGIATYPIETIDPKLLELAKELVPGVSRVAVLRSSADPPGAIGRQQAAAQAVNVTLVPIPFSNENDVAAASSAIERSRTQLLVAPDSPLLYSRRKDVVQLAAKARLPAVYAFREAVEDGGLMALSTDLEEEARRAAAYVDKILRGTKPADLPVEQPTTLQFTINLKTAKTLGITIPPSLLLRADKVFE